MGYRNRLCAGETEKQPMKRSVQLCLMLTTVVVITSVLSHSLVGWLGIRTGKVRHRVVGESLGKPTVFLAGSSLLFDGLELDRVSNALHQSMETWFVAGSSPTEWEPFQSRATNANLTIFGVSAYDLNDEFICDFRSQVIDLPQALRDLAGAGAGWSSTKRVLSQYPLKYLRILFPTAGRSHGVMGGLKEHLRVWLRPWVKLDSEVGPSVPTIGTGTVNPDHLVRISDWTEGNLMRQLAKMRAACQGRHSYGGLKKRALTRMLTRAGQQGRVVVVVLPVSAAYEKEFLTGSVMREFESTLTDLQQSQPEAIWVRLDQEPGLNSNRHFSDVVHMNYYGQQLATDAFLSKCGPSMETEAAAR
jgi:hypothetical protein